MTSFINLPMEFVGNKKVIHSILNPNDKKVVLILPSGGQRGIYEGGVVSAFEELKLRDSFSDVIGASTGAAVGYYFVAGESIKGTTIYFEDNVKNKFINFKRPGNIMDVKTLEKVFRKDKALSDPQNILKSESTLWFAVTNAKTGEAEFLNAKKFEDPILPLLASIHVPYLAGFKPIKLNDDFFWDGGIGAPLPIQWAIDHLHPTDILVLLNKPIHFPDLNFFYKTFSPSLKIVLNKNVYNQLRSVDTRYNKELEYITQQKVLENINIAAIAPTTNTVTTFTSNEILLKSAEKSARSFTNDLLANHS